MAELTRMDHHLNNQIPCILITYTKRKTILQDTGWGFVLPGHSTLTTGTGISAALRLFSSSQVLPYEQPSDLQTALSK